MSETPTGIPEEGKPKKTRTSRPKPDIPEIAAPHVDRRVEERSRPAETNEELVSRLKSQEATTWHENCRASLTHLVIALLLLATTACCLYVFLSSPTAYSAETQRLSSTLLTAIFSGGASFFMGKAAGQSKPSG